MLSEKNPEPLRIAVIIPAYKAKRFILDVIGRIGPDVAKIYVVDDACPEGTGALVETSCRDPRVTLIRLSENQGVGGAVIAGYKAALKDGMGILVKIDSDAQMDPHLIPHFAKPIIEGHADYTKGNRFFDVGSVTQMPRIRLIGNAILSLMTKFSTGYWNLFDPTNGYTAIHAGVAAILPLDRINKRYFFETDMLYYLSLYRAAVWDIPINAHYGEQVSNLHIRKVIGPFIALHIKKFCRRIIVNYFVRNFSFASLCLAFGALACIFGLIDGSIEWIKSSSSGVTASAGTVMVAAFPIIIGVQLLMAFFAADTASVPRHALHPLLMQRPHATLWQFAGDGAGAEADAKDLVEGEGKSMEHEPSPVPHRSSLG